MQLQTTVDKLEQTLSLGSTPKTNAYPFLPPPNQQPSSNTKQQQKPSPWNEFDPPSYQGQDPFNAPSSSTLWSPVSNRSDPFFPNPTAQSDAFSLNPATQSNSFAPNLTTQSNSFAPNPTTQSNSFSPNLTTQSNYFAPNPTTQSNSFAPNPTTQSNSFAPYPTTQSNAFVPQQATQSQPSKDPWAPLDSVVQDNEGIKISIFYFNLNNYLLSFFILFEQFFSLFLMLFCNIVSFINF